MKKQWIYGAVLGFTMFLTGCSNALNDETIELTGSTQDPAVFATFDNNANRVGYVKTNDLKIKSDKHIDQAVKIEYGQNKSIVNNATVLAYQGVVNYYHQDAQDNSPIDLGTLYNSNKASFPDENTVIVVKNKQDGVIGVFNGKDIHIKSFESDRANAQIKVDSGTIFVYDGAYETYPVTALKAQAEKQNTKRSKTAKDVTTSDAIESKTK